MKQSRWMSLLEAVTNVLVGVKAPGAHRAGHGSSCQGLFDDLAVDHKAG